MGVWIPFAIVGLALCIEYLMITRTMKRLGGFRNVWLTPSSPKPGNRIVTLGRRARAVRVHPVGLGAAGRSRRLRPSQGSIVLLADTRSVAARRSALLLRSLKRHSTCPITWTWYVGGSAGEVAHFVADLGLMDSTVRISRDILERAMATGAPVAAYLDNGGIVRHIGLMYGRSAMVSFVSAIPDSQLRLWFWRAASESAVWRMGDGQAAPHDLKSPPELMGEVTARARPVN